MLYDIEELNFVENFAKLLANYFKSKKDFTVIYDYNYQYLPSTLNFKIFKVLSDNGIKSVRIDSVIRMNISDRHKDSFRIDETKLWVIKEIRNKNSKTAFSEDMNFKIDEEKVVLNISDSEKIGDEIFEIIEKSIECIDTDLQYDLEEFLELVKNNEGI